MPFTLPVARKIEAPPSGIIRDGLVGRWPLDDDTGSSTIRDDEGSNPGALENMDPQTAWVPGREGTDVALLFAGNPEKATVPHDVNLNPDNISVSFWFKLTVNPGNYNGPLGKTNQSSMNNGWGFFFYASALRFYWGQGSNAYNGAAHVSFDVSSRAWHLAIGTYDGTNRQIYVDDVTGTSNNTPYNKPTTTNSMQLGLLYASQFFRGTLQDLRVYDRVLNSTERTAIFNGTG